MSFTLKEVLDAVQSSPETMIPVKVGENYLFRTIGYHWLGCVESVNGKWLVLSPASWVSDTGRYGDALLGNIGTLKQSELEPSPRPVLLNSDHVTDCVSYPYEIPKGQK